MHAWLARWRVALRIAQRDARKHKGRTVLVVVMLALPVAVAVLSAMMVRSNYPNDATYIEQNLGSSLQAELLSVGCKAQQDVRGSYATPACSGRSTIDPVSLNEVASILPSADTIEPAPASFWTIINGDRATDLNVTTVGPNTLASIGKPVSGRLPTKPREIALPQEVASTIKADIGDTVTLSGGQDSQNKATVVGIVATDNAWVQLGALMVWSDPAAAMTAPNQRSVYVTGPEPVTWDMVAKLNEGGYTAISRDVIENPPAGGPLPTPGPYGSTSNGASPIALAAIGVALIEVVMIIGPAFAVSARRSRRQLALVAASGGSAADLRRIVRAGGVVQGAVAGVLGGVLGLVLGGALIATVFKQSVAGLTVPWREWLLAVVGASILGTCAALLPSRSAARSDTLSALTGAPEPPPARHRKWVAPAFAAVGIAACVYGVAGNQPAFALGGAVGIEIALIFVVGPIVATLARLGGTLKLIPRVALRDAARQRTRTVPALAAVVVCVAGSVLGLVYSNASELAQQSLDNPPVAPGLIALTPGWGAASNAEVDKAARSLEQKVPGLKAIPVNVAASTNKAVYASVVPETDDSRCKNPVPADVDACKREQAGWTSQFQWLVQFSPTSTATTLVDDGTMIGANGLDGATEAARALRDSKVLVNSPLALDANGNVILDVVTSPANGTGTVTTRKVTVPGYVVSWTDMLYQVVLPPQLLNQLGMTPVPAGYLGVPASPLTTSQRAEVAAVLADGNIQSRVFEEPSSDNNFWTLFFAVIATVLAAAVSWIAVGLAAVDSLPDLGTLSAVGAAPSTRRKLAGAQAGVITVIGTVLGVAGGLVLAAAMIWYEGQLPVNGAADWSLHLQWEPLVVLAVGVPLVAIAGAALFTRSRQIAVRRTV